MDMLTRHLRISGAVGIQRRYFVMNSFDGVLTMLGVVVGSYMYGVMDAWKMVGVGVSASLAMAVSGFTGAYLTERAEQKRALKHLEKAMLKKLHNSIHADASRTAMFWAAIVDGGSPLLMSIISLSPFIASHLHLISPQTALYLSVSLICSILFLLGAFLGNISKESVFLSGLKMLAAGFATASIIAFLAKVTG
jgi:predicted membrane protein (TIGR00267 family)